MPRPRSDAGSLRAFSPEVLARAAGLRWEVPERSIERLIELLTNPALTTDPVPAEILRRSTLARHLTRAGRGSPPHAFHPPAGRAMKRRRRPGHEATSTWFLLPEPSQQLVGLWLVDGQDVHVTRVTLVTACLDRCVVQTARPRRILRPIPTKVVLLPWQPPKPYPRTPPQR